MSSIEPGCGAAAPLPPSETGLDPAEAAEWARAERAQEKVHKALDIVEGAIGRTALYNLIATGVLISIPGLLAAGAVGAAVHGIVRGFRRDG